MANASLQHGIWILACDGHKGLLFENTGDHVYPKFETREVFEHLDQPSHDLESDVSGRTFSGRSGWRAGLQPIDLHDQAEQIFLTMVAAKIDQMVEEGRLKKLIVAAPARALAVIRHELSEKTKKAVLAEFDKDFVRMPVCEIENHFKQLVSLRA